MKLKKEKKKKRKKRVAEGGGGGGATVIIFGRHSLKVDRSETRDTHTNTSTQSYTQLWIMYLILVLFKHWLLFKENTTFPEMESNILILQITRLRLQIDQALYSKPQNQLVVEQRLRLRSFEPSAQVLSCFSLSQQSLNNIWEKLDGPPQAWGKGDFFQVWQLELNDRSPLFSIYVHRRHRALDSVLKSTPELSFLLQALNSNWYYKQKP